LIVFAWWVGLEGEGLFEELWKACAGPLVEVPFNGERVFYFPQGHMEQVFSTLFHFKLKTLFNSLRLRFLLFVCSSSAGRVNKS